MKTLGGVCGCGWGGFVGLGGLYWGLWEEGVEGVMVDNVDKVGGPCGLECVCVWGGEG